MMLQPDIVWGYSETGWTAISAVFTAASFVGLSIFNVRALKSARDSIRAAKYSLKLLNAQVVAAERPFVSVDHKYDDSVGYSLVWARSQGNGPAIDVEAELRYSNGNKAEYGVGCLGKGDGFQFLIGEESKLLEGVTLRYKSVSGEEWQTAVVTIAGIPIATNYEKSQPKVPEASF